MPIKVLIVDDTDHVREMLSNMIELDGFEVVGSASGGPEAIALVQSRDPDVIIMDYKMPGMDGISATRMIRAANSRVPVILYTAYLDSRLEDEAREAGVSACIGKVEGLASLEREISALCLELLDRQRSL